jgi:hypothetical protein
MAVHERLELAGILFDAAHAMADGGQTSAGDETDVSASDNRDIHDLFLLMNPALPLDRQGSTHVKSHPNDRYRYDAETS